MKTGIAFFVIAMALVLSASTVSAQEQVMAPKLGINRSTDFGRLVTVSVENRLGKRLTFQPEFGFGFRNNRPDNGQLETRLFHFGVDGRAYLLLRQQKAFCGLYLAPFITHDRTQSDAEGFAKIYHLRQFTTGGLGIGFQQAIGQHFRVDGNLRWGRTANIFDITYNAQGSVIDRVSRGANFIGFAGIHIGYAF